MNEFIYPLRIQVEDTDFSGLAYHSKFINFMERARSEWFYELGISIAELSEQGIYFPIRSITIDYLKPARVHQLVEVVTAIKKLGAASIVFDQYLRLGGTKDKILCKAQIKVACVDANIRPRPLPEVPIFATIRRSIP